MIYESLKYLSQQKRDDWFGNTRWFVKASLNEKKYKVCVAPINRNYGDNGTAGKILNKTLFSLENNSVGCKYTVMPDTYSAEDVSFFIPYEEYGMIIKSNTEVNIKFASAEESDVFIEVDGEQVIITDGAYKILFVTNGVVKKSENAILIAPAGETLRISAAYHIDEGKALKTATYLFEKETIARLKSREEWEKYFNSCPVITDGFNKEEICRQYWCWWCLLINVSDIEFNDFPAYMSPEKTGWLGIWSNDGPECMAALSLTNQKNLARRLICSYIEKAIDENGRHSWYTHSDGQGCYGRRGDCGRLSNGASCIVHTVGFYIRNTGDNTILDEKLSYDQTLYERLKIYMTALYKDRDINHDSLIEWANLWESGWDDKLGCFFKKKPISEWWSAIETLNEKEFDVFYESNKCPVTTIVEQVYTLWALSEMKGMSILRKDYKFSERCQERFNLMIDTVSEKCWNEEDGFYHDIDVTAEKQIMAKSADVFYYLYFEKNPERIKRIYSHLTNSNEFALKCIPMQSADSIGFNANGYWSGGHWPREMSYLAMGLSKAGYKDKAVEILRAAITSGEGNMFYEVINPVTGRPSTSPTKMAYDIMDIVALLEVENVIDWTNDELYTKDNRKVC